MASHEGVGAGQKSCFQLLRKKSRDTLVGTSSGVGGGGVGSASGATPRPPPLVEKKRKKTSHKGES